MTDVQTATADILEDKPALEDGLQEVLAVDAKHETWEFDDIPLDSGMFGELVSRGIVEKVEGDYSVADREAVLAVVGEESEASVSVAQTSDSSTANAYGSISFSIPDSMSEVVPDFEYDRRVRIALTGALALVVLFRVIPFPAVFRGGDVVLSGNDPYAYRYFVHQLVEASANPFDFSVLSSLPSGMAHGEPLLVTTMWWFSAVLGGASAVGGVLAWYPVVSAVVTALLIYVLTVRVTEDRRVGIAAVALLAIIPAHAFRTGLGFADHHAFDYPWLALTALAVVSLAMESESVWDLRDRRAWGWALVLGVGLGGQTLAWDAGPLLLVPIALYTLAVVPSWLRTDQSPIAEGWPLVVGTGLGAFLVVGAHYSFGWHTTAVVAAPVLLFGGIVGVVVLGEAAKLFGASVRSVVGVEIGSLVVGFLVLRAVFPPFVTELDRGIDFLVSTEGIAETMSLVSSDLGSIMGPIFLFGFAFFLAVPYLAWGSWLSYRDHMPKWLLANVYGWYFLVLALIQIRFAGQLALFLALFGGLGFVHVAAWVDLTQYTAPFVADESGPSPVSVDSPRSSRSWWSPSGDGSPELEWPERREAMYLGALGLGVGSLGGVMTPVKHWQLTIDESMHEAARFMQGYSEKRGWDYPENYVFSEWGRNRVYNWFVNGESRGYGFAYSNFENFVTSTDGQEWYERMQDQVGFAVIGGGLSIDSGGQTIYERLWGDNLGLGTNHYRAVWTAGDDSQRVYTLVPGARVTGPIGESGTITVKGECEIDGESRSVSMDHSVGESGVYDVTVPLPGTYTIGENVVTVSEGDVLGGTFLSSFDGEGEAHWSFDEGSGDVAYDRLGGRHATITDGEWVEGVEGSAISFDGEGYGEARPMEGSTEEFTVSAWIKPETENSRAILSTGKDGGSGPNSGLLFDHGLSGWLNDRLGLYVGDGNSNFNAHSPKLDLEYPTKSYHHVAVVLGGETLRWYLDGELLGEEVTSLDQVVHTGDYPVFIGRERSNRGGVGQFDGDIDELRYFETALDAEEITNIAQRTAETQHDR